MKKFAFVFSFVLLIPIVSFSQFIEDALRYTIPNSMITPRSASFGVAFYGLSDDISGLIYNPAGLSFIGKSEFSLGLGFTRNRVESEYLFNKMERDANSSYVTHLGISVPVKEFEKTIIVGLAYFHENNFLNYFDYSAFNPKSSLVYSLAKYGSKDTLSNIPYFLWLANNKFETPIKDSVKQVVTVDEDGGLHNITGGFSVLLTKNVSIGASLTGKFGKFTYYREFNEYDIYNKYNFFDSVGYTNLDFNKFTLKENLTQKVSGISGSIGIFGTFANFLRFGATVKFPTYYQVEEEFRKDAYARFDDGWEPNPYEMKDNSYNSYKITTPFVFAGGVSLKILDFIFTGGVEYFDVTQLRFSDAPPEIDRLNSRIVRELVGQVQWGLGVQYSPPILPFEFRAGFSSITSPYAKDIPNATTYIYSLGMAIYLAPNVRLEPTFQYLTNSVLRTNYQTDDTDSQNYTLKFSPYKIALQITYRY
ncbi:MAG: hypothetical protein CH6_1985 [Candidatus Kapaibacterium sp.]|nr:MAG: hypothetical protein CH6_1985 [Candidatus Kapabacteria bacterium]